MPDERSATVVDQHIGARIRLRRLTSNLSQECLAEMLNVTFQQIQKYEKGLNRIGASRLFDIAKVLDVSVQFFFDDMPGDENRVPVRGGGDDPRDAALLEIAASPDGLALSRAFARVRDAKLRRRIVDLVRAMAGEDEAGAQ